MAKLLLVEDEAIIALEEKETLSRAGYSVTCVYTGEAAVEAVASESFDLIIMDIKLGHGISGAEAARIILADHDLPIVFLTSHDDPETIREIHAITRYGYVLKTSGTLILLEVIRMALELFQEHRELLRSRDLYRSIADLTGDIIVRHDADGEWVYLNKTARSVWNIPQDGEHGGDGAYYIDYVRPEDVAETLAAAEQMKRTGEPVRGLVNRVRTSEGERIYVWNSAPIFDASGTYQGFQSTGRDITEERAAVEQIRRLLDERELLLRELHHRVKNDLNFVSSLLSLQASQVRNVDAKTVLAEASERIRVVTGVYDSLHMTGKTGSVSVRALIESIAENLSAGTVPPRITIHLDLVDLDVSVPLSLTVGISVNELITNALKHAFGPDDTGTISVTLERNEDTFCVSVCDDGRGYPDDIDEHALGFGMTVVRGLAEQHAGTVRFENRSLPGGGTVACGSITFPLIRG
ncbi:MAG: sensor histidine kinase [Alkalispirochaeta sp.]